MKLQQLLLDTVAHLPELKVLCIDTHNSKNVELANFKPCPGVRYVEKLQIGMNWYELEKNGNYQ
jgi:hypothetical protein